MDWLDLFAVQGILKSLLQHHSSKASILQCSAFFTVQLSQPYMTTGKTIALTRWTFVGKVMTLLFNMLPRLVMTFLPRNCSPPGSSIYGVFQARVLEWGAIAFSMNCIERDKQWLLSWSLVTWIPFTGELAAGQTRPSATEYKATIRD